MNLRTPNLNAVLVALAGGYFVIAFAFGVASLVGSPVSMIGQSQSVQDPIAALGEAQTAAVDLTALRQRPIFTTSRRSKLEPSAEPGPPSEPGPVGFEDFNVVAIAIDGEMAMATLESSSGESARVKVGSEVRGWVVTNIDKTGVTLASGDEERRIDFRKAASFSPGETIRLGQGTPATEEQQPAQP